ncbi:hypothetical protein EIP86_009973 [Pleurotus ostreatoroseus]|nr:hypothetical protein EIP86_009973 [Pleurotus ostreatoroseus]
MGVAYRFLSPACHVPVIGSMCSYLSPRPAATSEPAPIPRWTDYPHLVEIQSTTLDKLLVETSAGLMLSAELRKAEVATTDLVTLVKVSSLDSRDIIATTLQGIVTTSKKAGKALTALDVRVNRAVDSIYAVNEYALRRISEAQPTNGITGMGWLMPRSNNADGVARMTFETVMSVLAAEMEEVILQCDASQILLDQLDYSLIVLHEILSREISTVTKERSELLAELWTMLGGNRRHLVDVESRLQVLKDLGGYRTDAMGHVGVSIQAVQTLTGEMEDLRTRVAAPAIVEERIPLEVQLQSIKAGLDRIRLGRRFVQEQQLTADTGMAKTT